MKVTVTKEHIKNGKPGFPKSCAIGLAIQELFDKGDIRSEFAEFGVRAEYLRISEKLYALPKEAQKFILEFDNKHHVEPFSFKIDLRKSKPFRL